ncbi:MAG: hypothetical protein ACLTDS_01300 [Bianqueaceae bacterium]
MNGRNPHAFPTGVGRGCFNLCAAGNGERAGGDARAVGCSAHATRCLDLRAAGDCHLLADDAVVVLRRLARRRYLEAAPVAAGYDEIVVLPGCDLVVAPRKEAVVVRRKCCGIWGRVSYCVRAADGDRQVAAGKQSGCPVIGIVILVIATDAQIIEIERTAPGIEVGVPILRFHIGSREISIYIVRRVCIQSDSRPVAIAYDNSNNLIFRHGKRRHGSHRQQHHHCQQYRPSFFLFHPTFSFILYCQFI